MFLAWDRPDRFQTDFTWKAFRAFAERVGPMLDGGYVSKDTLHPALAEIELARGEAALRPAGFDPALAARSLITLLAGGVRETGNLRAALTGTPLLPAEPASAGSAPAEPVLTGMGGE